ncbi:hypothetical protein D7S86_08155 [Pararobbsia silviterrae]|uniref:Uncharacterized protein n=2 Tax=Pararobbsia silviterrae TaxID=1792498 RepID=A0A494Y0S7_9BURK|nr:hypothetical protein D7S86_08155 [Pararobbsia silviterrae]
MTIFVRPVDPAYPTGVSGVYDYASLGQAMQDWFARTDIAAYVDYFIQKAEQKIYRDIFSMNRGSGVRAIESPLTGTIGTDGTLALPAGYLGLKYTLCSASGQMFELQRRNAEFIYTQYPTRSADSVPAYIARDGAAFTFGPFPDAQYSISGIYWRRFPQLTQTNNVNWMTAYIPTILLAACNAAVARFLSDDERRQVWDAEYLSEMQDFLDTDRAEEQSGSAFAMVAG